MTDGGEVLELPTDLNDCFLQILDATRAPEVIFLPHQDEAFTTQTTADYLGVFRQFLLKLLNKDEIPYIRRDRTVESPQRSPDDKGRWVRRENLGLMFDLVIETERGPISST